MRDLKCYILKQSLVRFLASFKDLFYIATIKIILI